MSDFNSELPIRSSLPSQVNYDDIIIKIGDATNPTTQMSAVDTHGSLSTLIKNAAGTATTSQANGIQQALDVGINVAGVQIDPRQIRALTSADVVSVVQSTSPWVTKDQSDGPVVPGTAASFSQLMGGQFNTALPTLTNTQQSAIQVDSSGRIIISPLTSASVVTVSNFPTTVDTNYGTVGASTIRVAAQVGNSTGAADFNAGVTGAQTLRTSANQGAPNTTANSWPTKITDGTNTAAVKPASTAAAAADPSLVVALSPTSPLPAGTNAIGTVAVSNLPAAVDTNYGVVGASTVRVAAQIGNATGAANYGNGATGAQTLRVAANLAVAGADVSGTNPVPVTITSAVIGTSVNNYNTSAALAAGATSNHNYTVTTGKTFSGKKIWASASGKLKIEVQTSPDGTAFTSFWVGFNSTANPNISIDMDELVFLDSGVGSVIRIIRTNKDLLPQDVYSTISGTEN